MSSGFDRLARVYRWMEYAALGPLLRLTREQFLHETDACRRALVLGDGDGRFTDALLRRNAAVRVHAVDRSAAMLGLLRRRCARATLTCGDRLRTTCADALEVPCSRETDLVVTHFFLDCLTREQVEALVSRVAGRLPTGALWVVSEFRATHWPGRLYVRALYLAFRVLTGLRVTALPDYGSPMERAGMRLREERLRLFGVLTAQLWQKGPAVRRDGP